MRALALATCLLLPASCVSLSEDTPGGGDSETEEEVVPDFPGGKGDLPGRSPLWSIFQWNYGLSAQDRHDKYCKMAASPFVFYRGSNHLFWEDLAGDDRLELFGSPTTRTWLQGDLHAYNFGSFENASGDVVYALNDFDESLIADYQYDLWRMAASMVLVSQENGDLDTDEVEDFVDSFTEAYLDGMSDFRGNGRERTLDFDESESYSPLSDFLDEVEDDNSRDDALDSWTEIVYGTRQFDLSKEKLGVIAPFERAQLIDAMADYQATLQYPSDFDSDYFQVKDLARRLLAGTGSLGTPRYYALIEGPTSDEDDDRILDIKLQQTPTPWWFVSQDDRLAYQNSFANHASRHTRAMSALVGDPDPLQGWLELASGNYSVRERSVYKESFPTDELREISDYQNMAEQWGIVLATAHARSDRDFDSSLIPESVDREIDLLTEGNHQAMRELVREVAFEYAQRVNDDYALFVTWLAPTDCPTP
jgi:uncharacterized protein (DUF2252 family)